ncbi:beta subunit of tryptophan synthase [Ascobolus immersus RN42]|uniref:Tryptophan synthase n=1 Tax=Ascobolus immersus RN42 TaxID=1160509 RepID=A0A3N4I8K5_ASCIM|nr:beta subunit of tryptophan synthase [Ascobolus immersus RN42]
MRPTSPLPTPYLTSVPTPQGFFGPYGGSFIPPVLREELDKIYAQYMAIKDTDKFKTELEAIRKDFQGRPTPLFYAGRLSEAVGGKKGEVEIWLKREDLNHTGAHKLNHCISEVLLAKLLGKTKVIAETGAGQHGVALATAAAFYGLECDIYMGSIDIAKESPNVTRMKILGARVIPATHGLQTLKEAVDSAFEAYLEERETAMYCIGSVVGPHPFPYMVREFQKVVGEEAQWQWKEQVKGSGKPDKVVACVGGGSNALGIFSVFIDDEEVKLYPVEPLGRGETLGQHAASLKYGTEGIMHGFNSIMLKTGAQTEHGPEPAPVYSMASGLDYPSVGPEHAYLFSKGRTKLAGATDDESLRAFFALSKLEGIIPALESCHAVAYAMKLAREAVKEGKGCKILVNLSGRGDKDIDFVWTKYAETYGAMPIEELLKAE